MQNQIPVVLRKDGESEYRELFKADVDDVLDFFDFIEDRGSIFLDDDTHDLSIHEVGFRSKESQLIAEVVYL